jgi:hypothetical protein
MRGFLILAALAVVFVVGAQSSNVTFAEDSDELTQFEKINLELKQKGLNIAIAEVEYFTIGDARPADRVLQQPFRWVANDTRRAAQGEDITYLVDQSDGATASGLTSAQTEAAIHRSMATWDGIKALKKVDLVKRSDGGGDYDIFDSFFGFGNPGNPFAADIVFAGWLPRAYFEAVGGPGGGDGILAFSVTFIFIDDDTGLPTDINGDNYLDTALNEVYFNDTFGDPNAPARSGNPWKIDAPDRPDVDVETVSLHEAGHSLGIGHFGPAPSALMNPRYSGLIHDPLATDEAGMQAVWASWPK